MSFQCCFYLTRAWGAVCVQLCARFRVDSRMKTPLPAPGGEARAVIVSPGQSALCQLLIQGPILLVLFPWTCQPFPLPWEALNVGQSEQGSLVPLKNTFTTSSVFSSPDFHNQFRLCYFYTRNELVLLGNGLERKRKGRGRSSGIPWSLPHILIRV